MASATTMAPSLANLSLTEKASVFPSPATSPSSAPASASYWTALLRESLSAAHSLQAGGDAGIDGAGRGVIADEILNAPRRRSARSELACEAAGQLYADITDPLAAIVKYEKHIVMLRGLVMAQRRAAIEDATQRNARFNWIKRISKQGAWNETTDPLSTAGAPSLPMPVEQSDKDSLAPFFAHLRGNGTHEPTTTQVKELSHAAMEPSNHTEGAHDSPSASSHLRFNATDAIASTRTNEHGEYHIGIEPFYNTEMIEFEKGVLYADGRVDLCKMVTGPRNIGNLMESLKPNTFSKHFLLGNNIIGPVGAKAIAAFIDELPNRLETWYLAGNCIDAASFRILVDAMIKSSAITNVWLKRNPLGSSAAADVFRLIIKTPNLRTLDLDQTELGDKGLAELFALLADHREPTALRNLYINGCGVSHEACKQIGRFLASSHCGLEALYMSSNPIGQAVSAMTQGLARNRSLQRLSLQSCGLKDEGVISLAVALKSHKTLRVLDFGQGYATEDLGMRYNWITDDSASALIDLLQSTELQYLNLSYLPMSQKALNPILEAIAASSTSLLWFHAKPLFTGGMDAASVKAGQDYSRLHKRMRERLHERVERVYGVDYARFESEHKRFLISPRDVRLIDSVYRNRDAGAARRGLKKLEKHWEDDGETLRRVQDGTLA